MAAEGTAKAEQNKPLEPEDQAPAPLVYLVAREAPGSSNLNTIDIFGERAFSV